METPQVLALIALSASIIEAAVEYIGDPFLSLLAPSMLKPMRAKCFAIIASCVGVTVAVLLEISLFDLIPEFTTEYEIVGQVLTGVLLGRGSDWFHAFLTKMKNGR